MLWQDLLIFHLFICSPHLEWSQSHCCPETDHVSLWWCVTFTVYCSQIMFFFAFRCVTFCWRIHSRIHCRVQQLFYLTIVHMFYVFRMMSECHCCPKADHVCLWCRVILVFNKHRCPVICFISLRCVISSCRIDYWSFLMLWKDLLICPLSMCYLTRNDVRVIAAQKQTMLACDGGSPLLLYKQLVVK